MSLEERPRYFDKDGSPLTVMEWARRFEDLAYKRVAETTLPDGKWVSTIWLGLNHAWHPKDSPLIFETMVFPSEQNLSELDTRRYSTLREAEVGHVAMVEQWTKEDSHADPSDR